MKILIVSQSFYPDEFKINDLIKDFSKEGHDITVLSGLGDYATGQIPERYKWFKNRTEFYNGCKIKRVRTIARRTGPIFRSLNYLSFAFFGMIWAFFCKEKFDLIYVYQPSPATMIFPGIVAAKKNKVPLLVYCLDIWPEAVKAMKISGEGLAFKYIHRLSKQAYQKANYILVSSRSFMDYLHQINNIPYNKMKYVPQHADPASKNSQSEMQISKAQNNFVFTGNIGYVQDVEMIIQAAAKVRSEQTFKIHIVGSGSNIQSCEKLTKDLQVEHLINFYGRLPAEEMGFFYEHSDACLLTLKNDNKIGLTIPAKLQGYMAHGKPVLAAISGDAEIIIRESSCGFVVAPTDSQAYAHIIEEFIQLSNDEKKELGENSFNYFIKNFTKNRFVSETLGAMTALIEEGEK